MGVVRQLYGVIGDVQPRNKVGPAFDPFTMKVLLCGSFERISPGAKRFVRRGTTGFRLMFVRRN